VEHEAADWLIRLGAPTVAAALSRLFSGLVSGLTWIAMRLVNRIDAIEARLNNMVSADSLASALQALHTAHARIVEDLHHLRVHTAEAFISRQEVERRLSEVLEALRVVEHRLYATVTRLDRHGD
jgi:uncharacterized protein YgfB (UPF0149 family)